MKVPNHIAIILDGNGRWAKARDAESGADILKCVRTLKISAMTSKISE